MPQPADAWDGSLAPSPFAPCPFALLLQALFDRHRAIAGSMSEAIDKATPAQQREFIELLVERVVVRDRQVAEIAWVPAARPFMAATGVVVLARPAGLEPTTFRSAT